MKPRAKDVTHPRHAPIRVQLDPDLADLIAPYLQSSRQHLVNMKAAATRSDWELISQIGHKILGTAGSYGFHDLSRIGGALEAAALASDALGVARALHECELYLDHLVVSYEPAA